MTVPANAWIWVCEKGHVDDHHVVVDGQPPLCSRCGGSCELFRADGLARRSVQFDSLRSQLREEVERLRDEANRQGRHSQHQANMLRAQADRLSKLLSEEGKP